MFFTFLQHCVCVYKCRDKCFVRTLTPEIYELNRRLHAECTHRRTQRFTWPTHCIGNFFASNFECCTIQIYAWVRTWVQSTFTRKTRVFLLEGG